MNHFNFNVLCSLSLFLFTGCAKLTPQNVHQEVLEKLNRKLPEFRSCYSQVLDQKRMDKFIAETSFAISPNGKVLNANATSVLGKEVDKCLTKVIESMKFPSVKNQQNIQVKRKLMFYKN